MAHKYCTCASTKIKPSKFILSVVLISTLNITHYTVYKVYTCSDQILNILYQYCQHIIIIVVADVTYVAMGDNKILVL